MCKKHLSFPPVTKKIKSVAVIGAGPAGAGCAKALIQENNFENIVLFEKRSKTGGLWNYSKRNQNVNQTVVPSENPFDYNPEIPIKENEFVWPSAIYDELDTNVPKDLMAYNNYPFDKKLPLYPDHPSVLKYLQNYSKDVEPLVRFNVRVVKIEFVNNKENESVSFVDLVESGKIKYLKDINRDEKYTWKITSREIIDETKGGTITNPEYKDKVEYFDAVCLASGNYDIPYLPKFPGIEEWDNKFPKEIIHAKYYNNFKDFKKDDKILIIGNSASGADIAFQLANHFNVPIYKSKRGENLQPAGSSDLIVDLPNIKKLHSNSKTVEFIDGQKIEGFNKIIFATGYLKAMSFINDLSVPFLPNFESTKDSIINETIQPMVDPQGFKINGTYQHCLSYQYPGLAIIGVPKYVLPTRISETQGAWISRVWSGRISSLNVEEMMKWELERTKEVEDNSYRFHSIPYPADVEYYKLLNDQILKSGKEHGLIPVLWDEYQCKLRKYAKEIKEAYINYKKDHKGETCCDVKDLKDYFDLDKQTL